MAADVPNPLSRRSFCWLVAASAVGLASGCGQIGGQRVRVFCSQCNGTGARVTISNAGLYRVQTKQTCLACRGEGKVWKYQ